MNRPPKTVGRRVSFASPGTSGAGQGWNGDTGSEAGAVAGGVVGGRSGDFGVRSNPPDCVVGGRATSGAAGAGCVVIAVLPVYELLVASGDDVDDEVVVV